MDKVRTDAAVYAADLDVWDHDIRAQVRRHRLDAPTEASLVDLAGTLKRLEQHFGSERRLIESEIPADPGPGTVEAQGAITTATAGRSATRTYNLYAIIADAQAAGLTIYDLIDEDALRVAGQWSNLKRVFHAADLTLRIAPHEVANTSEPDEESGKPPHVGEVWKPGSFSYQRSDGAKGRPT
jgi:hypothetical protein